MPEHHWQHRMAEMTCSDLIVAAPWIVFGIALIVLCVQLLRSSRR
jgi:hypothetical protein